MPYKDPEKRRECRRKADLKWCAANPEKVRLRNARRVRMFGDRFSVPSLEFRAFAVDLREQRKRQLGGSGGSA